MSETKKKASDKAVDARLGRYSRVELTREWAFILQKMDEGKNLNQSELVKKAMSDIMSGEVTEDDVAKARAKFKAAPPVLSAEEEKAKKIEKEAKGK